MECKVKWIEGGMSFLAETGSNHAVLMDGAPEAGGRNLAPRPGWNCCSPACKAWRRQRRHGLPVGVQLHFRAARLPLPGELFQRLGQRQAVQAMRAQLAEQGADMAMNARVSRLDVAHTLALRGAPARWGRGAANRRRTRQSPPATGPARRNSRASSACSCSRTASSSAVELALTLAGGVQRLPTGCSAFARCGRTRAGQSAAASAAGCRLPARGWRLRGRRRQRAANGQPAGHQRRWR